MTMRQQSRRALIPTQAAMPPAAGLLLAGAISILMWAIIVGVVSLL